VKLLATSVVLGSNTLQSHGGVYLVDLEQQAVSQTLDWNTPGISWGGSHHERGFRGIAFDKGMVFFAGGDELFAYSPDFQRVASWRNPYLKNCEEIAVHERTLFLVSTGCDSILAFDLDRHEFHWAMQVKEKDFHFQGSTFDPRADGGPLMLNKLHINSVYCDSNGMYISGLRTGGMLHFNGRTVLMSAELPPGSHNARPFRDGVLFNDSTAHVLRYSGRNSDAEDRAMAAPVFASSQLTATEGDVAAPGSTRGLCVLSDTVVAGGSSPATVSLYDLAANCRLLQVNLSLDPRSEIHGIARWPYAK
jgi:hypothetical protein